MLGDLGIDFFSRRDIGGVARRDFSWKACST
jgi:hypothetical protein